MSWRRLLALGLVAALAIGAAGLAAERWRLGADFDGARARAAAELRGEFDAMASLLGDLAGAIAGDPGTAQALEAARLQHAATDAARALFDIISRRIGAARDRSDVAVTIYDMPNAVTRAWGGRPSDIPAERIHGPQSWFVTQSAQGLRLVHTVPVVIDGVTVGVVAAEHALSPAPVAASISPTESMLPTRFGPAAIRFVYEGGGDDPAANAFVLRSPTGEVLLEASIQQEQVDRLRHAWRRRVAGLVVAAVAVTLLLLIGPLLDARSRTLSGPTYRRLTGLALLLIVAGSLLIWLALDLASEIRPEDHVLVLLASGTSAAIIALFAGTLQRWRLEIRLRRSWPAERPAAFAIHQLAAGLVVAAALGVFAWVLNWTLESAEVDLRHFSLHPWGATRLTLLAAVLAAHLAALWTATFVLTAARLHWRIPRRGPSTYTAWILWTLPSFALAGIAASRDWGLPLLGITLSGAVCATAALIALQVTRWFRHATLAARIFALFVAFWVPSLLLYPSVNFFTDREVRHVIASEYAVEAREHPQTMQKRLMEARAEIDRMSGLSDLLSPAQNGPSVTPQPESAFSVWRQTVLARYRLTSSVELFNADGVLVSRFALDFPEYAGTIQGPKTASCGWDWFGEAALFGSEERRMLHAERSVCEETPEGTRKLGSIVVHVVPDYRTLPFITSQSPYVEVFRSSAGGAPAEGATGSEVEIVIYGWGLTPLFASGGAAWPITQELFERIYASREPFWTEVDRGDVRWHVLFSNDRNGIYGLGYPALTVFDRFVHLAELTTLAGVAFALVLIGTAMFTRVARSRPRVGHALLREIRASFYRKLFLAFVLASIIPVLALALVIRAYFEGLLRADVEAQAVRAASVAQRVIEESDALQPRTGDSLPPTSDDDDVMIWISQVINQDVNIFAGPALVATSERDLFASGLLPTRTPDDVYRAIVLERLPSFVDEDRIGDFPYMIAATPVRVANTELVLTVPLATQQREIEREVDELDRGVHLAALFFILLGAAMGLSMAERIADPVRRLTRATRRIASGDFDARIAVKSADELRRLVDAFNSMADELKRQRVQLERTHRLEAWAEMARQVAHEIKNPLTPIQLSAEHLRRVHRDRGEPLGAVLDSCVTSILGQVRLLRQISSEFSNFASSPIAKPSAVDLAELVAEVVDPYRTGLQGRITIDNQVTGPLPRVFIDRTLIGRALSNIVENALHAMPGDGHLSLSCEQEGDAVVLRVRDTGAGMDEEALARVFEPYFSTKATGTGLGLPIARRNVELSGGRIEVESARGQGTLVIVRLPIVAG